MALWKDSQNKVHDDMNGEALSLPSWPQGLVQITQAEADALLAPPPPTQAEQFKAIERAIEQHMDAVAQADGWDDRKSCALRAGYAGPWQSKGVAFGQWMDSCWQYTIQEQAKIVAGTRTMPTPAAAVAELPAMVW